MLEPSSKEAPTKSYSHTKKREEKTKQREPANHVMTRGSPASARTQNSGASRWFFDARQQRKPPRGGWRQQSTRPRVPACGEQRLGGKKTILPPDADKYGRRRSISPKGILGKTQRKAASAAFWPVKSR